MNWYKYPDYKPTTSGEYLVYYKHCWDGEVGFLYDFASWKFKQWSLEEEKVLYFMPIPPIPNEI